jgi:hypothetical protein
MNSVVTKAQKGEFGIRYMPTFSSFDIKSSSGGVIKGEVTMGFGFGAFLGFNFTEHVGVQGEIIYTSLSQKYKDDFNSGTLKLRYINIPLLLSFNTGKTNAVNLNFVAGPQLGLSVGSSINSSSNDGTTTSAAVLAIKKGDLGFAYGAGVDFGINNARTTRLGLGYRGVLGIVDISDKNRSLTNDSYYVLDRTHLKTNAAYIGISFLF